MNAPQARHQRDGLLEVCQRCPRECLCCLPNYDYMPTAATHGTYIHVGTWTRPTLLSRRLPLCMLSTEAFLRDTVHVRYIIPHSLMESVFAKTMRRFCAGALRAGECLDRCRVIGPMSALLGGFLSPSGHVYSSCGIRERSSSPAPRACRPPILLL
ncbi:hypothetical protein K523DRAFT_56141 [Schizophyllum commune Tattone D]|nr:hypothetical protein K523DRAFT_56141 [Schizophyllum commune Tattone D]